MNWEPNGWTSRPNLWFLFQYWTDAFPNGLSATVFTVFPYIFFSNKEIFRKSGRCYSYPVFCLALSLFPCYFTSRSFSRLGILWAQPRYRTMCRIVYLVYRSWCLSNLNRLLEHPRCRIWKSIKLSTHVDMLAVVGISSTPCLASTIACHTFAFESKPFWHHPCEKKEFSNRPHYIFSIRQQFWLRTHGCTHMRSPP